MNGFMTTKEAAGKWNISVRQVQYYCKKGIIKDAVKVGTNWLIPNGTQRPQHTFICKSNCPLSEDK